MEEFCRRVATSLDQATFEQRRQLVELLIDRVVVTGEEVEIRYVIPTSASSEHVRFCHLRKDYFNAARPHQGLAQKNPEQVIVGEDAKRAGKIIAFPVLNGLHHDYQRAA
jgi:hypothetical protein